MEPTTRWGPCGPPARQAFSTLKAPRSGPRRAPGGLSRKEYGWRGEEMKLHAVAPGGPPEDHCEEKHEMLFGPNFDDPFRTSYDGYTYRSVVA